MLRDVGYATVRLSRQAETQEERAVLQQLLKIESCDALSLEAFCVCMSKCEYCVIKSNESTLKQ
jgi:hypothetical protein